MTLRRPSNPAAWPRWAAAFSEALRRRPTGVPVPPHLGDRVQGAKVRGQHGAAEPRPARRHPAPRLGISTWSACSLCRPAR